MKKYMFEADKKQWEKPTEPKYVFCAPARVTVLAENPEEAKTLAAEELRKAFLGTGCLVDEPRCVAEIPLPEDWNYGYGDARGTGSAEDKAALFADNKR